MKIQVLAMGKPRESFIVSGIEHYQTRLKTLLPVEWTYLPEPGKGRSLTAEQRRELEGIEFLRRLGRVYVVVRAWGGAWRVLRSAQIPALHLLVRQGCGDSRGHIFYARLVHFGVLLLARVSYGLHQSLCVRRQLYRFFAVQTYRGALALQIIQPADTFYKRTAAKNLRKIKINC